MKFANLTPAQAAQAIIGMYDTIPAMDPKMFSAGLVDLLSSYPQTVIDRAARPSSGLAGKVIFPNLARFKEHLDQWRDEHYADLKRREKPKALPEPPHDPEMAARIERGLRELSEQLKRGFGPSTIKGQT